MDKHSSFDLLLETELRHLYCAAHLLEKQLPYMIGLASSKKLKLLLKRFLQETRNQIQRLHHIFELLDIDPHGSTLHGMHGFRNIVKEAWNSFSHFNFSDQCKGMEALLEESSEIYSHFNRTEAADIALISNAQKMDHFEIACYRFLCHLTEKYGMDPILGLLRVSLKEGERTYEDLSDLVLKDMPCLSVAS
jgi:ferritin-like metal-binding protein YciE